MGLTRASVAFFSGRVLAMDTGRRRFTIYLVSVTVAWTACSIFALALRGPIAEPWVTLDGSAAMVSVLFPKNAYPPSRQLTSWKFYRWLIVEIVGLLVDLGMLAVAIWVIWSLQMTLSKRMAVSAIFAARLLM